MSRQYVFFYVYKSLLLVYDYLLQMYIKFVLFFVQVVLLMKNLCANLKSPQFEDYVSTLQYCSKRLVVLSVPFS